MASTDENPDTVSSVFKTTSEVEFSRTDRWLLFIDVRVLAPFRVMWDDTRTKVGLLVVGLYVFMGTLGIFVIPRPDLHAGPMFMPPFQSLRFPLGTDKFGQSIFRSLVHATPAMLKMIVAGAVFTVIVATIIGTVSGLIGGMIDRVLMTFTDIMLAIPGLPLVIVIAITFEPRNPFVVGLVLSINAWAGLSRAIRSQVLAVRHESYVEASQTMGLPTWKIIVGDVLPNLMPYITVNFMQAARNVIFASVGLYFLGLLPFTTLNWGVMMNLARTAGALRSTQVIHWLIFPMVTITLFTFGLIALAQGMDRVFNPRVRARHTKSVDPSDPSTEL